MVPHFQVINTPFTFNMCILLFKNPPVSFNEPSDYWHLESISFPQNKLSREK